MRQLALWGKSLPDYLEMFDLSEDDINANILEYGCGPNAINLSQHQKGYKVVSWDPLFALDKETLAIKASLIFASTLEKINQQQDLFHFDHFGGMGLWQEQCKENLQQFFSDYERGKKEARYIAAVDYHLPQPDFFFDFALSSHYLFADLYDQTLDFHLQVIRELARVAKEVRIFPLIDKAGKTSPLLGPVLLHLQQEGFGAEVREISYQLHRAENAMLRVWAQKCDV